MDPKKVKLALTAAHTGKVSVILYHLCSDHCGLSSLCRASCSWWRTSCSDTLQRTLLSFCTKGRGSTRRLQEITWEKGGVSANSTLCPLSCPCTSLSNSALCCCATGMTSTSKSFRLLLTSTSSLISTLSRRSGRFPAVLPSLFRNLLTNILALWDKQTFSEMESPTVLITSGSGGKKLRKRAAETVYVRLDCRACSL